MNFMDFHILLIDRNLDTITTGEWRQLTWKQRDEFINQQRLHGYMSMSCLNCGYPTERDVAWCEACLGETSESRLSELEKDKKP